jgi:hypothetical protein
VFEFVHIILGASLAEVVKQLSVMVFQPAFDAFPGVADRRRWGETIAEVLHLYLGGDWALVERTADGATFAAGNSALSRSQTRGVWRGR